jgi:DNA-binding beta-propeller fold protein YncE
MCSGSAAEERGAPPALRVLGVSARGRSWRRCRRPLRALTPAESRRGRSALLRGGALLVALLIPNAYGASECSLGWRVAGADVARLVCRDGDAGCDVDGRADGACRVPVAACVAACDAVRARGAAAAAVNAALGTRAAAECSREVTVRVPAGRGARLRVVGRDAAGKRAAAALGLSCRRSHGATALVVTTDFETGLLATVGVRAPHDVGHPAAPIHSDAVVRVTGGDVFVVNRFLGDNLQVLDPSRGLATRLQCSTGPGSNPHDVAVVGPHKAYVTRYDARELWIVDPSASSCAGFRLGSIDLSPWADADGLPEMDQMAVVGGRLFVSLERLDRTRRFAPAGRSRLAVIDTATDAVVTVIELTGANAFGDASGIVREPGSGKLVISEDGNILRTGDGGLERVDPETLTAEGFFLGEQDLGGNVTDFVLASPTKGYAIVLDDQLRNVLVAFDPQDRTATRRLLVRTQYLPDVALAPDGTLWVADDGLPAPGIRIFDTSTDTQRTTAAIDVGLPPFSLGFLP